MRNRKRKILKITYSTAFAAALLFYGWSGNAELSAGRIAADYASDRAFEETAQAVLELSRSLEKCPYAADAGMCALLCGDIYANALAAEAAMATLPFSTHELEKLSAFLNTTGDYARKLCFTGENFGDEDREKLSALAAPAKDFAQSLQQLRQEMDMGELFMDSRKKSRGNVGEENGPYLSRRLLDYEAEFDAAPDDGSPSASLPEGELNEEEMKALAAEYAGVDAGALKLEYEYEGTSGRKCYSVDELLICVSPRGVESMGQSRLVDEKRISLEDAQQIAKKYLSDRGFDGLELSGVRENGAVAVLEFLETQDSALWLERGVKIAIAMDDGSVYSFNAESYRGEKADLQWEMDEKEAAEKLPEKLNLNSVRKVIMENAAGEAVACYEFECTGENGEEVKIYADAATGKQTEIKL